MRFKKRTAAAALIVAISTALAPAYTESANAVEQIQGNTISSGDLAQTEADLEKLFNVYLKQENSGIWTVNEQAAARDGMSLTDLQTITSALNSPVTDGASGAEHAIGSTEWARCAIDYAGYGAIFELISSDTLSDLKAKRFERPARAIIRILGRAAIRGGVARLVASLAAGVSWCSTPWAR